jgi:hypothetical protein
VVSLCLIASGVRFRAPNDTLAKLQAAPHTSGDAARPLPRLTNVLAEATCNGRDAVANESAEALQRRASVSAVCQLQLVVRRRLSGCQLQCSAILHGATTERSRFVISACIYNRGAKWRDSATVPYHRSFACALAERGALARVASVTVQVAGLRASLVEPPGYGFRYARELALE